MKKRFTIVGLMLALLLILGNVNQVQAQEAGTCGDNITWSYNEMTKTLTLEGTGATSTFNFENVPWLSFRENIENVVVGEGITKISDYTFYWLKSLEYVSLPSSLTEIGPWAFAQTGLSKVELCDNVTKVGAYSFAHCPNLTVFRCSDKCEFANLAFDQSPYDKYEGNGYRFDGIDRFLITGSGTVTRTVGLPEEAQDRITTVVVKGDFTSIGNSAFLDFESLKNITLPSTIESIGMYAFRDTDIEDVSFLFTVKSIGRQAFAGTKVRFVTLTTSVTNLDSSAFMDCAELESLRILCPLNEKLNLNGCDNLKSLTYNGGPLGFAYFSGIKSLETVGLGDLVTTVGESAFSECSSLTNITFADGVKTIEERAFRNCTSLEAVKFPGGLESIGDKAFDGCTKLSNVTLNIDLQTIGEWAFNNCPALTEIYVPKSVTSIGDYAFHGYNRWYADNPEEKEYDHYFAYETPFTMYAYKNSAAMNYALEPKYIITLELIGGTSCSQYGHRDGEVVTETIKPTCKEDGKEISRTYCADCGEITRESTRRLPKGDHDYVWKVSKKATASTTGSKQGVCTACGEKTKKTTINKIYTQKLSYTKIVYNGIEQTPELIIKDSKGNALLEGVDYTVTKASGRVKVGRYKVTVKYKGDYSGSKTLYYTIVPGAPKNVKATLSTASGGYDDVKVTWDKVKDATGYIVYYKKYTSTKWSTAGSTTKTSYTKKNLSDGSIYDIKVVPYYKTSSSSTKYYDSNQCEYASVSTMEKLSAPKVKKYDDGVRVDYISTWDVTGYEISQSTSKSKTKIVSKNDWNGGYVLLSAAKGKTYYYKVRCYRLVGDEKVYTPWSSTTKFKR